MSYLKKTERNTYEKYVTISNSTYLITVPVELWITKSVIISSHIKYCISQIKQNKNPNVKYGTIKKIDTITDELLCKECNKKYKSRSGLLRHIKAKHITVDLTTSNIRTISTQTGSSYDDLISTDLSDTEHVDPSAPIGYVYCFSCDTMPGMYKIGMTTRKIDDRLSDANRSTTWQLPNAYKCELFKRVHHPYKKEQTIHKLLEDYRITNRREFFKIPLAKIKLLFSLLTEVDG